MHKLTAHDPEAQSADLIADNLQQLKALFPEACTEGKIDFEVLKQLLGGAVEEREEKYGLNWHGKRRARQLALTPSTGTLRPCPEDSVDWDTTRNLMIEGDNLEVLKLLQKSYAGKVKLIYIDPPYNTGKDFVYPDDYRDNIRNYLELTGQVEGGRKISSNTEASGRFHTDWLNMMYPRLKLARNLLRDDGVIFISIDNNEVENLRMLCNEIFGEENFIEQIIWKKRSTPPNDKIIGANHDYILGFSKNIETLQLNLRERSQEQIERYRNPDNHVKGDWTPGDLMANVKGGRYVTSLYFPIVNPNTGEEHYPSSNGNWRFSKDRVAELLENNEIYFGENGKGRPKLKRFLIDVKDGVTYPTIWDFVPLNTEGSSEMAELLGSMTAFENPKPCGLIEEIIKIGSNKESIIVDFFAGSGTTGNAVIAQNAKDNGTRRFVIIQLPEPTGRIDHSTIAELTKERLRRAAAKIKNELTTKDTKSTKEKISEDLLSNADKDSFRDLRDFRGSNNLDLGFRVFKLDSSNIRAWEPDRDNLPQSLFDATDHLKTDRSEQDILFELLLKLGLDLTIPIEQKTIAGKTVHNIGAGVLLVCLAPQITAAEVEPLALGLVDWHQQLAPVGDSQLVFRDSAFADDVAKTNLTAILQQHGLDNVRSL
ncbi:Site-specific DNA-methyltransferase (Adenine-specific) [Candidatus Contendobacter odensis Run_B_J11]|uniref:site-specific DNA-methyltransferase (adenine-specific) n=2 Tax=Candidatus Contendibacter odensensis TaxID=1400860 RepID=A0A7U7J4B1_9GAMM|nr:site-specific DNA-methyltransferase [Candidatus Contendobacter odensis]CDH46083.1 Site-specific DNA-methyltransferase (Adenine-specific) [Candidatus Contendobacter odensis Run_B_J11]